MRHLPLVLIATLGIAGPRLARAQSAAAEALFDDGNVKMNEGKLDEACQAFEASNRVEARAGTLIRLGECREKNNQLASAWSAYKDALTRVKDPNKKAIATAKVAELEPKLSYMTIAVADPNRVPGLQLARNGELVDQTLWNRKLPVDGGKYIIVARAPGRADWTNAVEVAVDHGDVTVTVPALAEPLRPSTPATPQPKTAPAPLQPVDEKPEAASSSTFTTKRKIAIGAAAVSVASLGVGIVLGAQARSKRNEAADLCPDPMVACGSAAEATALSDAAHSRAITADVMFGVAGAAAIGAAVLWITGAPTDTASVAVIPGLSSISVLARF